MVGSRGRGRRDLSGVMLLFCPDGNMGYRGVCVCQSLLNGTLEVVILWIFCLKACVAGEQTGNKYWCLVNNICAEVFTGEMY